MFTEIKNFIKKTVGYDPGQKTGKFGGTGSHIDDQEIQNEPNGYNSNQNVPFDINVDGGKNTDLNVKTVMTDIQDWHTNATQELLGNPTVNRPSKNRFQNVDAELAAKYYGNMK
jgi:hypothetical protein